MRDKSVVYTICELIETTGLSILDICKKVKIGRATFYRWKQDEACGAIIKKALETRNEVLAEIGEDSLMKKIQGYTVTEKKEVKQLVGGEMVVVKSIETTKFIEPDTTAIIFLLTNLRPDKWKRNVVDKEIVDNFKEFILKTSVANEETGNKD